MIMYKRFLPLLSRKKKKRGLGASLPDKDATVCLSLALETISIVRAFIDAGTLRRGAAWYCTYFVFQAALVLVIAMLKTEEQEQVWIEGIESAEECLKAARSCLGDGAQRCLDVLRGVGKLWRQGGDRQVSPVSVVAAADVVLDGGGHNLLAGVEEWSGGMGLDELGFSTEGMGVAELGLDNWMVMDTHCYGDLALDPVLTVRGSHNLDGM